MMRLFTSLLLIFAAIPLVVTEIHDPLGIFCGKENCYEVIGVQRTASLKEVKSAYRKLSLTSHPDKSDAPNATAVFRRITKAYEVLTGNGSRDLFNYYLDHPRDYFKVSGTHYLRNPPKIDYRITIIALLLLFSLLLHVLQYQRWEFAVKSLVKASICNMSIKNGGTKEAQEIYRRANEAYDTKLGNLSKTDLAAAIKDAEEKNKKNKLSAAHMVDEDGKPLGHTKMQRDPLFHNIIDDIVSQVQFEGSFRRPTWKDALIVHVAQSPLYMYQWMTTKKEAVKEEQAEETKASSSSSAVPESKSSKKKN